MNVHALGEFAEDNHHGDLDFESIQNQLMSLSNVSQIPSPPKGVRDARLPTPTLFVLPSSSPCSRTIKPSANGLFFVAKTHKSEPCLRNILKLTLRTLSSRRFLYFGAYESPSCGRPIYACFNLFCFVRAAAFETPTKDAESFKSPLPPISQPRVQDRAPRGRTKAKATALADTVQSMLTAAAQERQRLQSSLQLKQQTYATKLQIACFLSGQSKLANRLTRKAVTKILNVTTVRLQACF